MLCSRKECKRDGEESSLVPYHLSSADNSGAGLFNLMNSKLDAQSIEKSLVGVGRGRKAPASNQPIRQRKIPQCRDRRFLLKKPCN